MIPQFSGPRPSRLDMLAGVFLLPGFYGMAFGVQVARWMARVEERAKGIR